MGNINSYRKEFGLIFVGAIIFVASFMWKDVLMDIEDMFFPKSHGIVGRLLYTFLITVILVMAAVHLKLLLNLNGPHVDVDIDNAPGIRFDDQPKDTLGDIGSNVDQNVN